MAPSKQAISKRSYIKAVGGTGITALAGCVGSIGGSNPDQVNIGVVMPFSGALAFLGKPIRDGVELAVNEINEAGGIQELGGADLNIVSQDAGDSPDKAVSAAQNLLSNNEVSAMLGSVNGSFTLGVMNITEREQVPLITLSYTQKVVEQGNQFVFKTSPRSDDATKKTVDILRETADARGKSFETAAIATSNNESSIAFKESLNQYLPDVGVDVVAQKSWKAPLSNVTQVIQDIKQADPDVLFNLSAALEDISRLREKMAELDFQALFVGQGGYLTLFPIAQNIGKAQTQGMITASASHPTQGQEDLVRSYIESSEQPFMQEEGMLGYGHVYLVKEAVERSGSTDSQDVRDTLSEMTVTKGNAVKAWPIDQISFKSNGMLKGAPTILAQWQDTENTDYVETDISPFSVAPPDLAQRNILWP